VFLSVDGNDFLSLLARVGQDRFGSWLLGVMDWSSLELLIMTPPPMRAAGRMVKRERRTIAAQARGTFDASRFSDRGAFSFRSSASVESSVL
jgi:hypothetical protein